MYVSPILNKTEISLVICTLNKAPTNTLVTWCEKLTHWKRPRCRERLRAERKGATEDEMVGWHYLLNGHAFEQYPGQWRTGKSVVLQSMGLQRVRHDWVTDLNWIILIVNIYCIFTVPQGMFLHFTFCVFVSISLQPCLKRGTSF